MRGKLAGMIVMIALVAGCGGSQHNDDLPTLQPTTEASPTGPVTVTFDLPYHVTMSAKDDDGYAWVATLDRGIPQPAKDFIGKQFGNAVLGTSCEVDPQTAAIEPFTITVVNKTPNTSFTADAGRMGARLGGEITVTTDSRLRMFGEVAYSDGQSECDDLNDFDHGVQVTNTGGQASGATFTFSGWIVFPYIFSPARPDGEWSLLQQGALTFTPRGSGRDSSDDPPESTGNDAGGLIDSQGMRLPIDPRYRKGNCLLKSLDYVNCRPT